MTARRGAAVVNVSANFIKRSVMRNPTEARSSIVRAGICRISRKLDAGYSRIHALFYEWRAKKGEKFHWRTVHDAADTDTRLECRGSRRLSVYDTTSRTCRPKSPGPPDAGHERAGTEY